ncbi:MAG: hypothetical protein ACAI25_14380, partial [Planctomycetota bacterium]
MLAGSTPRGPTTRPATAIPVAGDGAVAASPGFLCPWSPGAGVRLSEGSRPASVSVATRPLGPPELDGAMGATGSRSTPPAPATPAGRGPEGSACHPT